MEEAQQMEAAQGTAGFYDRGIGPVMHTDEHGIRRRVIDCSVNRDDASYVLRGPNDTVLGHLNIFVYGDERVILDVVQIDETFKTTLIKFTEGGGRAFLADGEVATWCLDMKRESD